MADGKTRVSVVAPGNLGSAIAEALLKAGNDLAVWNRRPGRTEKLVAAGAVEPGSLQEALERAEVVVFALPDHDAVEELFGPALDAGWLKGRTVLNVTTGDASDARATNERFTAGGADYLDGDCGSYPQAIGTDASACIYSGPKAVYDRIEETVIKPIGLDGAHVGEDISAANALYMATTGFFFTALSGYFEGAAHATRHGIGADEYTAFGIKYMDTLRDLFTESAPLLRKRDHSSIGMAALELYLSGADSVLTDAEAVGARTDMLQVAIRYFTESVEAGHAQDEISAMFEVLMKDGDRSAA